MMYAAHPAEFFAATRASRTAVDEIGERRTMSGRFFAAVTIDHKQSAVIGRNPEYESGCHCSVVGEYRGNEASFAFGDEFDRLIECVIRHHCRDRTESFGHVYA